MLKNKMAVLMLSFVFCLLLTSCSRSTQVENQAYVLVMGLDRNADGQLQMSVQVPRISGGGSSTNGSGSDSSSNYTQMSVTGEDFETALEKLDWAAPRDLNLSHMKLIVLSRTLAEEYTCAKLIENIAQTERLFTSTKMVVCEGSAKEFISAMKPVIGTRISTDIDAMFDHYTSSGYVPRSSLAELFYQTASIYSDPMITYAILDQKHMEKPDTGNDAQSAAVLSDSLQEVSASYESEIPTRYLGAAVFKDGRLCGVLNGTQTIIANLLRNDVESFRFKFDNQSLAIVPARQAFVHVDTSGNRVEIRIDAKLSISAQEEKPDEARLRKKLETEILDAVSAAQDMGAEPFGFAEHAARNFLTLDDWKDYNWQQRFKDANIEIELSFAYSDT